MNYRNAELIDALAAEYVLGTLKGRARQRFARLLVTDTAVREAVAGWERRLGKLTALSPPVVPPNDVWRQLEQRLFPEPVEPRWYQRLALWRGLALASSLGVVVLAALLVLTPPPGPMPDYAGMLISASTREPVWAASTDASMERLMIKNQQPMTLPPDRGCILWLEVAAGERHLIGQLPDDGSEQVLALAPELRPMLLDSRLVVTVEDISLGLPQTPAGRDYYFGRMVPLRG